MKRNYSIDLLTFVFLTVFVLFSGLFWGHFAATSCQENPSQNKNNANDNNRSVAQQLQSDALPQGHSEHDTGETSDSKKCSVFSTSLDWFAEGKFTDWAIVFFTGVLAWKTWGLDTSTKKLWTAAIQSDRPWFTLRQLEQGTLTNSRVYNSDGSFESIICGFQVSVEWINSGNSPAAAEIIVQRQIVPYHSMIIPEFEPVWPTAANGFSGIIGPDKTATSSPIVLNDLEFQAFINRKTKIAIYSAIRYTKELQSEIKSAHTEICGFYYYSGDVQALDGRTVRRYGFLSMGQQNSFS